MVHRAATTVTLPARTSKTTTTTTTTTLRPLTTHRRLLFLVLVVRRLELRLADVRGDYLLVRADALHEHEAVQERRHSSRDTTTGSDASRTVRGGIRGTHRGHARVLDAKALRVAVELVPQPLPTLQQHAAALAVCTSAVPRSTTAHQHTRRVEFVASKMAISAPSRSCFVISSSANRASCATPTPSPHTTSRATITPEQSHHHVHAHVHAHVHTCTRASAN